MKLRSIALYETYTIFKSEILCIHHLIKERTVVNVITRHLMEVLNKILNG